MTTDIGNVKTRALVRELVRRAPGMVSRRLRFAEPAASDPTPLVFSPSGRFVRQDSSEVQLWSGYRDEIKPSWRRYWWPTDVLIGLSRRVELPGDLAARVEVVLQSQTLQEPLAATAEALADIPAAYPEHVRRTTTVDPRLGIPTLALVPSNPERAASALGYRSAAEGMLALAGGKGKAHDAACRVLEIGCGTGFLTYAFAGLGVRQAVGIDLALRGELDAERMRMYELLIGRTGGADRAELVSGDAHSMPFPDDSFDLVVSLSTLEHVSALPTLFEELRRVLAPGGVTHHIVDPWFSPRGGHSLCTLDFPWGHLRVSEEDFAAYVQQLRPYEAPEATDFYHRGFQTPRLSLDEVEEALVGSGLEILDWHEQRIDFRNHKYLLDAELLAECRSNFSNVTPRDLVTDAYSFVARKR